MPTIQLKIYRAIICHPTKCGVLLLSLLLLSACSNVQNVSDLPLIPLMPPQALGQHWQLSQSVILQTDAKRLASTLPNHQPDSFLVAWSVSKQSLDFVGLTPSGHVLMTLRYDGERFSEEYSPALSLTRKGMAIPGREIIAQLQLTYWPLDTIKQRLTATPWRIVATEQGRNLYLGKRQILNIHITPAKQNAGLEEVINITNNIMGYRLTINTLTRAVLP